MVTRFIQGDFERAAIQNGADHILNLAQVEGFVWDRDFLHILLDCDRTTCLVVYQASRRDGPTPVALLLPITSADVYMGLRKDELIWATPPSA